MKKILILMLTMITLWSVSNAQVAFNKTAYNPTGAILNTNADTLSYTLTRGYSSLAIQPKIVKATGTMAGKSYLSYSVNGVDYITSDSLTLTDAATNTTVWTKTIPAKYWRLIRNGGTTVTGTSSATLQPAQ